jgi:hypothetical protein
MCSLQKIWKHKTWKWHVLLYANITTAIGHDFSEFSTTYMIDIFLPPESYFCLKTWLGWRRVLPLCFKWCYFSCSLRSTQLYKITANLLIAAIALHSKIHERAMSLWNGSHLPTTQCACADFVDFTTQRNGRRGREKDLLGKSWTRSVHNITVALTKWTIYCWYKATCFLFVGLRDRPPENDGRVVETIFNKIEENAKSGVVRKGSVL